MLLNKVVAYWGDYLYASSPQWVQQRPDDYKGKGVLR